LALAVAVGLTAVATDAEAAKRLGGGKSTGMQREAMPQKSTQAAPAQPGTPAQTSQAVAAPATTPAPAAAPAASKRPGWLGPVAGIAAGLGLAALASHFGFGEQMATMLMLGLAFMAVLAVVGFIMRRRTANTNPAEGQLAYGGAAGFGHHTPHTDTAAPVAQPQQTAYTSQAPVGGMNGGSMIGANLQPEHASQLPAGFDAEGFVRQAKVQFVRLQAANDAGNLDDIREFTTPEMFAELRMDLAERGQTTGANDVTRIDAEVVQVAEEPARYVVSIRFTGDMRDTQTHETDAFHEIWHLTKPRGEGNGGWVLAGIQQA